MNKKQKKTLYRIIITAVLFLTGILMHGYSHTAFMLAAYFVIGWDVLYSAFRGIIHGAVFDENFLMSVATVGAWFTGEYPEAVFVMLFYQVGELFQSIAVGKSRKSIAQLMEIRPDNANLVTEDGIQAVDPASVQIGDVIEIRAGEKIPLDGVIISGMTDINTLALTGEAEPSNCGEGDSVISGCVNISGVIRVRVTKEFSQSTVSKILELAENSAINKSKSENFITRFARIYTPVVVICAMLLAVVPTLVLGFSVWKEWLYRAMTFLVISCPCALVISVPLTFFGGIGGLSGKGILAKGGNHIETLASVKTAIFDKTGTLTCGSFEVKEIKAIGISKEDLIKYAALAESASTHPMARAVAEYYGKTEGVSDIKELAGMGVSAVVFGKQVLAGNRRLIPDCADVSGSVIHVSIDGKYCGYIILEDKIKPDAKQAISDLKNIGITEIVMLTGDKKEPAQKIAKTLGITKVYAELLPADKVSVTEQILKTGKTAYIGDGINDAPVLARADVGIAMGALGSDAAIEAADIVIMDDSVSRIAVAVKHARFINRIVIQNIVFVLAVKALILLLGALGLVGMWSAVFADVGVAVIAILNAMRTLK